MSCLYMTTRRHSISLFMVKKGKSRRSSDPVISARRISTNMDPTSSDAGASFGGNDSVITEATMENGCEASSTGNISSMHGVTSQVVALLRSNAT